MKIAALQTARAGSKSVPKKNLLDVGGHPLFSHSIMSANEVLEYVYCTTDDKEIMKLSKKYNFNVIKRPDHLCSDNCSHLEVMRHGVIEIEKDIGKLDVVVILVGNVVGADSSSLKKAIHMLGDADSVAAVSEYSMFNPYRANIINNGFLETVIPQNEIPQDNFTSDKKAFGEIYFCNSNFFVIKRDIVFRNDNNLPYPFLGKKIKPFIQEVNLELDAAWQIDFVKSTSRYNSKHKPEV